MDIKQQTKNVAAQGRFGDSMLLHVNPAEVRGLAQAMPITVNPQTGQPEAFLPFLAPLLGSTLFSSLAASGALGATLAANTALASGIGAGLATYAQTGGSGSKALLSGLTSGLGSAAASKAAAAVDPTITNTVSQSVKDTVTTDLLQNPNLVEGVTEAGVKEFVTGASQLPASVATPTLNQAGQEALQAELTKAVPFTQSVKTMFSSPQGTFDFDQGASAAFDAISSPSGIAASTAAGAGAIMQSQDAFEAMLLANEEERRRRRQEIIDANPENIPFKTGESTSFPDLTGDGKVTQADILKGRGVELKNGGNTRAAIESAIYEDDADAIADMLSRAQSINPFAGTGGSNQVAVPKRRPTAIPQNFMAGFQPEMQYFQNLNPTATEITDGTIGVGAGFDPTQGGTLTPPYEQPSFYPRTFNPTETAAYRNFYGQGADLDIPYQVDPYSPISYGEKQRYFAMTGKDLGLPTGEGTPMPAGTIMEDPDATPIKGGVDALPKTGGGLKPLFGDLLTKGTPSAGKGAAIAGTPDISQEEIEEFVSPALATGDPEASSEMIEKAISEAIASSPNVEELIPQITIPEQTSEPQTATLPVMMQEAPSIPDPMTISPTAFEIPRIPIAQNPLLTIPTNNLVANRLSRLEAEEDVARPMVAMRQEGGTTNVDMNDPLVVETIKFILGEVDSDTVVQRFIDKFSPEDYRNLRRQVLESIVPNAQTEGRIAGVNNGGMTDDIGGMIGGNQPVAVSQDEYIVPADAVAMLGDGSSASGAKKLDQMLDRIRMDKTGTTEQAKEINDKVLPA